MPIYPDMSEDVQGMTFRAVPKGWWHYVPFLRHLAGLIDGVLG